MAELRNLNQYINKFEYDGEFKQEKILIEEAKLLNIDRENDICYMQKMFVKGEESKFLIFSSKNIYVLTVEDEANAIVKVNVYNKSNISTISYKHEIYDKDYELIFSIRDNDFILSSYKDTNETYNERYCETIKLIINYLIS
ncbi:hypothetical protein [Clostridium paraputrificum]|uniref:hypothetical protein n=1 Tax=Clostridium paraputrificum TaxID=29363 RepID=UPI00374EB52D